MLRFMIGLLSLAVISASALAASGENVCKNLNLLGEDVDRFSEALREASGELAELTATLNEAERTQCKNISTTRSCKDEIAKMKARKPLLESREKTASKGLQDAQLKFDHAKAECDKTKAAQKSQSVAGGANDAARAAESGGWNAESCRKQEPRLQKIVATCSQRGRTSEAKEKCYEIGTSQFPEGFVAGCSDLVNDGRSRLGI